MAADNKPEVPNFRDVTAHRVALSLRNDGRHVKVKLNDGSTVKIDSATLRAALKKC